MVSTENEWAEGDEPLLPYAGTSGWSGSEASRDRAEAEDSTGVTSKRQRAVVEALRKRGPGGGTWLELAMALRLHHGQISGPLSVLHKEGFVARLTEQRGKCSVYVLPEFVEGRATKPQGRERHEPSQVADDAVLAGLLRKLLSSRAWSVSVAEGCQAWLVMPGRGVYLEEAEERLLLDRGEPVGPSTSGTVEMNWPEP